MVSVSIRDLLEAGAHFGHQVSRWNPKMKKFIFEKRNGIHILDLQKTAKQLDEAYQFVYSVAQKGGTMLFVGTKRQAKDAVKAAAAQCNMHYVSERWLGGTLTNIGTIRKSITKLEGIEGMETDGTTSSMPKKELSRVNREKFRLNKNLSGVRNMKKHPDVIFVVDSVREEIAVKEANKLRIPIISLVDTNCDPDVITYPIACNDDAIRTIQLIANSLADAMNKGRAEFVAEDFTDDNEETVDEVKEEVVEVAETVTIPDPKDAEASSDTTTDSVEKETGEEPAQEAVSETK